MVYLSCCLKSFIYVVQKSTITYKVSDDELGLRLDQFLSNNISKTLVDQRIKL